MATLEGVTINNTLGAILVGFAVSCVAYGILLTQIYVYFSRYPSDRPMYKYLVRAHHFISCIPNSIKVSVVLYASESA
jgi:hypothetical protein